MDRINPLISLVTFWNKRPHIKIDKKLYLLKYNSDCIIVSLFQTCIKGTKIIIRKIISLYYSILKKLNKRNPPSNCILNTALLTSSVEYNMFGLRKGQLSKRKKTLRIWSEIGNKFYTSVGPNCKYKYMFYYCVIHVLCSKYIINSSIELTELYLKILSKRPCEGNTNLGTRAHLGIYALSTFVIVIQNSCLVYYYVLLPAMLYAVKLTYVCCKCQTKTCRHWESNNITLQNMCSVLVLN